MIRIRYISVIINVHRPIFITAGLITHTHIYQWYTREREREREKGQGRMDGWTDGQTDIDIQMTYTFTLNIILSRNY